MIWYQSVLWLIACLPVQGMERNILDELCRTNSPWDRVEIPLSETEDTHNSFQDSAHQNAGEKSRLDNFEKVSRSEVGPGDFGNDAKGWNSGGLKSLSPNHAYLDGSITSHTSLGNELDVNPKATRHGAKSSIVQKNDPAPISNDFAHWLEVVLDSPPPNHVIHDTAGVPTADTRRDTPVASLDRNEAIFPQSLAVDNEHTNLYQTVSPASKQRAQGDTLSSKSSTRNSAARHSVEQESGAGPNSDHSDSWKPEMAAWETVLSKIRAEHRQDEAEWLPSSSNQLGKHARPASISTSDASHGSNNHQNTNMNGRLDMTREEMTTKTRKSSVQAPREVPLKHSKNERKRKPLESALNPKSKTRCKVPGGEPSLPLDRNEDKSASVGEIIPEDNPDYLRLVYLCKRPSDEEDLELPPFHWDLFDNSRLPVQEKTHLLSSTYHATFKKTVKTLIEDGKGKEEQYLWLSHYRILKHIESYESRFNYNYRNEVREVINKARKQGIKSVDKLGPRDTARPQIRDTHLATVFNNLQSDKSYLERLGTHQIRSEVREFIETLSKIPREGSSKILARIKAVLPIYLFYVKMIDTILIDKNIDSPDKTGWKLNEAWKVFKLIHANVWVPETADLPKLKHGTESNFLENIVNVYEERSLEARRKRSIVWHMLTIWLSRSKPELYQKISGTDEFIFKSFKQLFNDIFIYTVEGLRKNDTKSLKT